MNRISILRSFSVFVLLSLVLASPFPLSATTLTGTFKSADGALVNGKLIFLLSQPARLSDQTAQIVPLVKIFGVVNGQLESGAFVYGNDVLTPGGTYYLVRLVDSSNNLLFEQKWSIQGTNLDLGTMTPTTTGVVLPDPLIKNASGQQAVNGPVNFNGGLSALSLVLNGNLTPGTTDVNDLGSSATAWRELYARKWGPTQMVGSQGGLASAPSLAPFLALESSNGGSIVAGAYHCVVTYANRNGETTASPEGSLTVSGSTNKIYVRIRDFNWASGAYAQGVYCGTSSGGPYYLQTPATVSFAIANNGISRTSGVITVTTTGNHGLTYLGPVTIAGATGCASSPNGTYTVKDPPPSPTTFTVALAGSDFAACGGASATASYVPAFSIGSQHGGAAKFWYAGNNAVADVVLSEIVLSGDQPPSTNTATIDPIQVAVNAGFSFPGTTARPTRSGRSQLLGSTTYTLTTPLICFSCSIEGGAGTWFGSVNGSNTASTIITSSWNDPSTGTVMVMGQESQLRRLKVTATGTTNAIMATTGDHSGNGLWMEGIAAGVPNGSTTVAAFKAYRMNVSQQWRWEGVTLDGGRFGAWFSNSNVSQLKWANSRVNCGSPTNSSAIVHSAGPPDVSRGTKNINDPVASAVSLQLYSIQFELCQGIAIDFGGGFLGLYDQTGTADSTPASGTEAGVKLWSDNWSSGTNAGGFMCQGCALAGSANYLATLKFGPGANDYNIFPPTFLQASVGPSTGSGTSVTIDGGNNFGRQLIVINGGQISADPNASVGKIVNMQSSAAIYVNGDVPQSGSSFNVIRDRLFLYPISGYSAGYTFKVATSGFSQLQFIGPDGSTVFGQTDHPTNGGWSFRGGLTIGLGSTPSSQGNAINMPNGYGLYHRSNPSSTNNRLIGGDSNNNVNIGDSNTTAIFLNKATSPGSVGFAFGTTSLRWGASFWNTALDINLTGAPFILPSSANVEVANLNAQVWHGKQAIDFSATLDFASIAAQTCSELTITATGAVATNPVAESWPAAIEAGLVGNMRVSANDTVTVRLCNVTTGAIDPASRTYAGRVIK